METTASLASGSTIADADGKKYIDLGGVIGVINAGNCPPKDIIENSLKDFLGGKKYEAFLNSWNTDVCICDNQ